MRLYNFPSEVLQQLADYLEGHHLVRLWLTGDSNLRYAISTRGSIKEASFYGSFAVQSTSRLPGMIGSLTYLTNLKISAYGSRIARPRRIWECLSRLRKLKSLYLSFVEAEQWLLEPICEDFGHSLFESPTDAQDDAIDLSPPSRQLRPIAKTFSELESLSLGSGSPALVDEDIGNFPKTLTALELPYARQLTGRCYLQLYALPKITKIWLPAPCEGISLASLPFSISDVRILTYRISTLPNTFWNHCNIRNIHVEVEYIPKIAHMKALEELRVVGLFGRSYGGPMLEFPNLRILEMTSNALNLFGEQPTISAPNLEKLDANWPIEISPQSQNRFPVMLKDLKTEVSGIDPESLLLRSITSLSHLTSLNLRFVDSSFDIGKLLKQFPKSLRSLHLARNVWTQYPLTTSCMIVPMAIFPSNLTTLVLNDSDFVVLAHTLAHLPRHLRTLELKIVFNTTSELTNGLLSMPNELHTLRIAFAMLNGDQILSLKEFVDYKTNSDQFRGVSDSDFTLSIAKCLPLAHLSVLRVNDFIDLLWCSEAFKLLNPKMSNFNLLSGRIDPSAISSLPRDLLQFTFSGLHFLTSDCFKDLPRKLTVLTLSSVSSFTDIHLRDLPKTLCWFDVEGNPIEKRNAVIEEWLKNSSATCKGILGQFYRRLTDSMKNLDLQDPVPLASRLKRGEIGRENGREKCCTS